MNIEHNKAVHISVILDKLKFTIDRGTLSISDITPIKHSYLLKYLDSKCIPLSIAKKYARQLYIYNKKSGKHFYALGFKNDENGYEICNEFVKGYIGKRDITFIRGSRPKAIHVFKDCADFLSIVAGEKKGCLEDDTIVLNSISLFKDKVPPYIQHYGYKAVYSWLGNDKNVTTEKQYLDNLCKTEPNLRHMPQSFPYKKHKTINEWWIAQPKTTG